MKMPPSVMYENKSSNLLSLEENQQVFQLLGTRCQAVYTCVVQLFNTQPPAHSQWIKKDMGVLCFVKDNLRKNYFFRLFCLKRAGMLWEHEIYSGMEYLSPTEFLHVFEGEDCMIAFNFASTEEARDLKSIVDQKLAARKRREEKLSRSVQNQFPNFKTQISSEYPIAKKKDPAEQLAKRKRNITKADIGQPSEFRHVTHIGFDSMTGFDVVCNDEELTEFFRRAGVSKMQLEDTETRKFIYEFITKNGGREAIKQVTNEVPAPAPPSPVCGPPVPPRGSVRSHNFQRSAPPPPPTPTQTLRPSPRIPPPVSSPSPAVPPPPASVAPPPPPPPPPMQAPPVPATPPPPLPPMDEPTGAPAKLDMHAALMDSIREGTSLKAVEVDKKPPPVDDARGNLLSEIRKGFQLKPATEREMKPVSPAVEQVRTSGGTDLASALARALADRNRVIHSEDDSSTSDSNDDEWDD